MSLSWHPDSQHHRYSCFLLLLLLCDTAVGWSHRRRNRTSKGCDAWLWHGAGDGDGDARLPLTRWGKRKNRGKTTGFSERVDGVAKAAGSVECDFDFRFGLRGTFRLGLTLE